MACPSEGLALTIIRGDGVLQAVGMLLLARASTHSPGIGVVPLGPAGPPLSPANDGTITLAVGWLLLVLICTAFCGLAAVVFEAKDPALGRAGKGGKGDILLAVGLLLLLLVCTDSFGIAAVAVGSGAVV